MGVARRTTTLVREGRSPHGPRISRGGGAAIWFAGGITSVTIVSDRMFVDSYAPHAVTSDGRIITTQPIHYTQPAIHLVTNWNNIHGR